MSAYVEEIRKLIEEGDRGQDVSNQVSQIISNMPENQVGPTLMEVTESTPTLPRAYLIAEFLEEPMQKQDKLFEELVNYLLETAIEADFGLILLDFLHNQARVKESRAKFYVEKLRQLAASQPQPASLRAAAIRFLNPRPAESAGMLRRYLESNSPSLVDAAAHVIANWQQRGEGTTSDLASDLTQYAGNALGQISVYPGILMALVGLKTPESRQILADLIANTRTPEDRARILGTIGRQMDVQLLAVLIGQVIENEDSESEDILRSIFTENLSLLIALYETGRYREYVYCVRLVPSAIDAKERKRHQELYARSVLRYLSPARAQPRRNRLRPSANLPNVPLSDPVIIEDAYNTTYHKADAIYSDLDPTLINHWHASLYLGFEISRRMVASMRAVQAIGPRDVDGFFDTVRLFQAEIRPGDEAVSFASPTASVKSAMEELQRDFEDRLKETVMVTTANKDEIDLHGARRTPNITAQLAESIADTAVALVGRGIIYTLSDMLRHKWELTSEGLDTEWQGRIEEINSIRCDGVVEYCYERHGQRACGGLDPSDEKWNITKAGNECLDNHNNFHAGFYFPEGELCPRIQAGSDPAPDWRHRDVPSNDPRTTRFTTEYGPTPPEVAHFYVTPQLGQIPPTIYFRIDATRYDKAYVRLTVRRKKEDAETHFIDDRKWLSVDTNTSYGYEWWGQVSDQLDFTFQGEHGEYEFHLVAIDLAGNVSHWLSQTASIFWCGVNGVRPPEIIVVPPRELNFGSVIVGLSHGKSITVENKSPCEALEVELKTSGEPFSVIPVEAVVPPYESREFHVVFKPTEALCNYSGVLTIKHNDQDHNKENPITISLAGTSSQLEIPFDPSITPIDPNLVEMIWDILGPDIGPDPFIEWPVDLTR